MSRGLRLGGKVAAGSINWDPKKRELQFEITDEKERVTVLYQGVIPDTFRGGADIVVEGLYTPEGVFRATELMVKCLW